MEPKIFRLVQDGMWVGKDLKQGKLTDSISIFTEQFCKDRNFNSLFFQKPRGWFESLASGIEKAKVNALNSIAEKINEVSDDIFKEDEEIKIYY